MAFLALLRAGFLDRLDRTFGVTAPNSAPALSGAPLCASSRYVWRRRAKGGTSAPRLL
jgi:hypothetical protein